MSFQFEKASSANLPESAVLAKRDAFVFPVSITQRRYFILEDLTPGNPSLIMAVSFQLLGELNVEALEKSINEMVRRHEILRTAVTTVDNEMVQIVTQDLGIKLPVWDLADLTDEEREAKTRQLVRDEALKPFDVSKAPLFHVGLLRLSPTRHQLLFAFHYIISDGWSNGVLLQNVCALYSSTVTGQPSPLPELPVQFADFAAWERERFKSDDFKDDFSYWMEHAGEAIPLIDIPTDRPRTPSRSIRSELVDLLLPAPLADDLRAICSRENTTLFMLTLAAFKILLHRYSLQTDILVGSPIANRNADTEDLIGPFANTVILRTDLSGDPSVLELLDRVRKVTLGALQHQSLPFEKVFEEMEKKGVQGLHRLFQFTFLFQKTMTQPFDMPGLTITPMVSPYLGTQSEMFFLVLESAEGIRIQVPYLTELFDRATLERTLGDYQKILACIAKDPSARLSQLRLPDVERPKSAKQSGFGSGVRPGQENAELPAAPSNVQPRNALEFKLRTIWERVIGVSPLGVTDNFFALGGHSFLAVRLLAAIERECGRKLPLRIIFHAPSIEQMAVVLAREGWKAPSFSLIPIQRTGPYPPLFCVSAPGGGIPYYHALSKYLGPNQPVYAFHPLDRHLTDGADQRDFPIESRLSSTAAIYIRELLAVQAQGPFYLCGHSWGGTLAYIVALELQKMGHAVAFLGLMDAGFHAFDRRRPFLSRTWLQVSYFFKMSRAEKAERTNRIFDRLWFKATSTALRLLPAMRLDAIKNLEYEKLVRAEGEKDRLAISAFRPEPYRGHLTLFRCNEQSPWIRDDPELGWKPYVLGGVRVIHIPGHHGSIVLEPGIQTLAKQMSECLKRSREEARKASAAPDKKKD